MDDWWLNVTIREILVALAGFGLIIVTGTLIVKWIIRSVHPIVSKLTDLYELVVGKPGQQGLPAQLSMMDRFDNQDRDSKEIKIELSSLKKEVSTLKNEVASLNTKFDEHTKEEKDGRNRA